MSLLDFLRGMDKLSQPTQQPQATLLGDPSLPQPLSLYQPYPQQQQQLLQLQQLQQLQLQQQQLQLQQQQAQQAHFAPLQRTMDGLGVGVTGDASMMLDVGHTERPCAAPLSQPQQLTALQQIMQGRAYYHQQRAEEEPDDSSTMLHMFWRRFAGATEGSAGGAGSAGGQQHGTAPP